MNFLVPLAVLLVTTQANAVRIRNGLKYINKYVTPVWSMEVHEAVSGELNTRIISGTAVIQGEIPWHALIFIELTGVCSGTLISDKWVLSAAHCLEGFTSFEIVLGGTTTAATGNNIVTESTRLAFVHTKYDENTAANDIGLLRLPEIVTFTRYISAVRLPSLSQISCTFEGDNAAVSGYGRFSSTSQAGSSILLETVVTVISNEVCVKTFGSLLQSSNVCAVGVNGNGPCERGDSGGPLVIREEDDKFTLVGITSFGVKSCAASMPTAYVRVTSYLNWISNSTGIILRP